MEKTASEIIKRLRRLSLPSQLETRALDQELVRVDLEQLLAERESLKQHLQAVTDHMDRAGGDAYAMPECPWCHAQETREGDDKWHQSDCELAIARAALSSSSTPQEQQS